MIYLYILRCDNKIFYTGITNNLRRRLFEHFNRRGGYTSRFNNFYLVHFLLFENRTIARKIEKYIKLIGAAKCLSFHARSL